MWWTLLIIILVHFMQIYYLISYSLLRFIVKTCAIQIAYLQINNFTHFWDIRRRPASSALRYLFFSNNFCTWHILLFCCISFTSLQILSHLFWSKIKPFNFQATVNCKYMTWMNIYLCIPIVLFNFHIRVNFLFYGGLQFNTSTGLSATGTILMSSNLPSVYKIAHL